MSGAVGGQEARSVARVATRGAAWLGLLTIGAFFMSGSGTYPGIYALPAQLVAQLIAYGIIGVWALAALRHPTWGVATSLLPPVAFACVTYVISALQSQRPRLSLEPTLAGLAWAAGLLILTRIAADPWFRQRIGSLLVIYTAVVSLGYIGQVVTEWVRWWISIGQITVPPLRPAFDALFLGGPNILAATLLMIAPLAVVIAHRRFGLRPALALGTSTALAVLLSGSRGALLGILAAFVVAGGLLVLLDRRGRVFERIRRSSTRVTVLSVVGGVVAVGWLLLPALVQRLRYGGFELRLDLWNAALSIFATYPITGGGPGTYPQLKVLHGSPGEPNAILPHAHSLYLQVLAELGLVGLMALAIIVVTILVRVLQTIRGDGVHAAPAPDDRRIGPGDRLEAVAVLLGWATFAGQSLVDNLSNLPIIILPLLTTLAWVQPLSDRPGTAWAGVEHRARRFGRLASAMPVGILIVLAAAAPRLVQIDVGAMRSQAGDQASLRGDWSTALDHYQVARRTDPGFVLYQLTEAAALGRLGRIDEARDLLSVAIELDPIAVNQIGLAMLELKAGQSKSALERIRDPLVIGTEEPTVDLNAGYIAEATGEVALALDRYAAAVAAAPSIAASAFWSAPERRVSRSDVVSEAIERVRRTDGAIILAYAGDPAAAAARLEDVPPSADRTTAWTVTVWLAGDPDRALEQFEAILRQDPLNWRAAAWAHRVAWSIGDLDLADRYRTWAITVERAAALRLLITASIMDPGEAAPGAGLPGSYPSAVYGRPTTPHLLISESWVVGSQ